jgi:hypothetical protein
MTSLRRDSKEYKKWEKHFETVRDELLEAFKVIFKEEDWCKRALCRDAEGEQLFNPQDERATQWCLLGAIYKKEEWTEGTLTFLTNYAKTRGIEDLSKYNDHEGHTAVVMLLVEVLDILGVTMKFYDDNMKEIKAPK